jgi:hypothetical protein
VTADKSACSKCRAAASSGALDALAARAKQSVADLGRVNYAFLTFEQMRERLALARSDSSELRLRILNLERSLSVSVTRLSLEQRVTALIASHDIPRVGSILRVAYSRGLGAYSVLALLQRAVVGAYKARASSQMGEDIALLVLRVGGQGLADTIARALGIPSSRTTRRRIAENDVCFEVAYSLTDVATTVHTNVRGLFASKEPAPHTLHVVAIDDVAVHPKLGIVPGPEGPMGVGFSADGSRESGAKLCIALRATGDINAMVERVHEHKKGDPPPPPNSLVVARFATVVARHDLSGSSPATPIMATLTCGARTAEEEAALVQSVVDEVTNPAYVAQHGRTIGLGRDGDPKARRVYHEMTKIPVVPEILPYIGSLQGMRLLTMQGGVVVFPDTRHIIKGLRERIGKGVALGNIILSVDTITRVLVTIVEGSNVDAYVQSLFKLHDKMCVSQRPLCACPALPCASASPASRSHSTSSPPHPPPMPTGTSRVRARCCTTSPSCAQVQRRSLRPRSRSWAALTRRLGRACRSWASLRTACSRRLTRCAACRRCSRTRRRWSTSSR